MTKEREEYRTTAETYAQLGESYLESIQEASPPELEDFIKLLPPGASILEIGTAGGRDVKRFVKAGLKVFGVDVVDQFIEKAKENVPEAEFKRMNVLNLELPAESFDGVWANAVLIHLKKEDLPRALENIKTVLKPGGKLHVRFKEGSGERFVAEKLSQNMQRYFSFFSKEEVEEALLTAGFRIIRAVATSDDIANRGIDVTWINAWAEK